MYNNMLVLVLLFCAVYQNAAFYNQFIVTDQTNRVQSYWVPCYLVYRLGKKMLLHLYIIYSVLKNTDMVD